MGEESTLSERELLEQDAARHEREAARRLELAAAKRRHAAELARIEAEFGDPAAVQHTRTAPPESPKPEAQRAETGGSDSITMDALIRLYVKDKLYTEKRFRTRKFYDRLIFTIERDLGTENIADIDEARVLRAYEGWSGGGKLSISHALVTMLRTLVGFGAKQLHRKDCRDLKTTLSDLKFPRSKSQPKRLTADHAIAICAVAHQMGHPSIALAQAFQFDCMLPQKDVLGDWVPQGAWCFRGYP